MKFYLTLFICILSTSQLFSDPIILDDQLINKTIGLHIEYFIDENKSHTIDDISSERNSLKWIKSENETPGFGYTKAAYWIRFTIKNAALKEIDWYLEQQYPLIDFLHLYIPEEDSKFRLIEIGDHYPFSQRPVKYRTFVFPLKSAPDSIDTYYARYETSGSLTMSLRILSPDLFQVIKETEAPFLWMFYGFLIVMLIYNFFIFLFSKDISYLFYLVYIAAITLLFMTLNGMGPQYLWPNAIWWSNYSLPLLTGVLVFAIPQFARSFIGIREYSKLIDIISKIFVFLGISITIFNLTFGFLNYYRFCIISTTLIAGILTVIIFPLYVYLAIVKKSRQALFWIAGFGFVLIGALVLILKTYSILPESFITSYALQIGAAIQVVLLSLGLADRINVMRIELKKAEKKYRQLVEGSNDIIFSLDENLNFLSVNQAIKKQLGFKNEEVINKNFLDFIQETWGQNYNINRQIVEGYIKELKRGKTEVIFRTQFNTKFTHEPKDLSVKLEYTESGSKIEFLGKASSIIDDIILELLESESHTYLIGNYLSNAEFMSLRLTRNLNKYINTSEANKIRVAIREILINSIEHGNLNLTFDEKTEAMMEDNYLQFIEERQNDPRYSDKQIKIEYILNKEKVTYIFTDQGEGFDHEDVLKSPAGIKDGIFLSHGRGLLIVREAFDSVEYNDKGNQVSIVKYFK